MYSPLEPRGVPLPKRRRASLRRWKSKTGGCSRYPVPNTDRPEATAGHALFVKERTHLPGSKAAGKALATAAKTPHKDGSARNRRGDFWSKKKRSPLREQEKWRDGRNVSHGGKKKGNQIENAISSNDAENARNDSLASRG